MDKEINSVNVDDYIRERVRSGDTAISWDKHGWQIFSDFVQAASGCGMGLDINVLAMSTCIEKHNHRPQSGVTFMGIKHIHG